MPTTHLRSSLRPFASLSLLVATAFLGCAGCGGSRAVHVARAEGDFHYQWGRYEEAAPAYLEIIDRYPGDWEAEYRYGMCLVHLGREKEARTHIETAAARNPESQEVAFALADVYAKLNERGRLVQLLKSRANERAEVESWLKLAELGRGLNDLDLEHMAITAALQVKGESQWKAYVRASELAEAAERPDEAVRRIRQAYYLNPHSPIVINRLETMRIERGPDTALPPGL
ncbi:MAG: tetratricopeptide repeat protein [Phycisphaerae bacterium]|jgi:tetratricopeptide (TPR) repeat protein|nr:tetratricopeptide repeat protein [Phycisphaerae bacterium]